MYNQDEVNENLEQLFDLPKRTMQETQQNIMRATPSENNQIIPEAPKKKGRGGARKNSGRKPGSVQKLSGAGILQAIADLDVPFEQGLAEDYKRARESGDLHVIQKYQSMILNKVIADKQEMDITSNGQTIGASFTFPTRELPEWQNDEPTKH